MVLDRWMHKAGLLWLGVLLAGCATASPGFSPRTDPVVAAVDTEQAWRDYRGSDAAKKLHAMLDSGVITANGDQMPIHVELIWDEGVPMPEDGYPVYISLHGGGAFTEEENHEQWEIQFTRYPGVRGIYVCPHSPLDTWDQWHNVRIFALVDTLVRALLLRDDVDPNRVYLNGYCSGGNGVYQLGPILADRFAACSATKAFREGAPLVNLRNLPIDLNWGEMDDEALDRPGHNRANVEQLLALHEQDPAGYDFRDIEHWRQGKFVNDKSTMRWMSRYTRDPFPDRVVWQQDGQIDQPDSNPAQRHFYWLGVEDRYAYDGVEDHADARLDRGANTITIHARGFERLVVYLNDQMVDFGEPVTMRVNGEVVFAGYVERSAEVMRDTLLERGDPAAVYTARVVIDVPR